MSVTPVSTGFLAFLNLFAGFVLFLFGVACIYNLGRITLCLWRRPLSPAPSRLHDALDRPLEMTCCRSLYRVITFPFRHFGIRYNRVFNLGIILYHVDIVLLSLGYLLAAALITKQVLTGGLVPDMTGMEAGLSTNYSLPNLLALIFGSGEHGPATFLYGGLAPYYIAFTWVLLAFAATGNALLLATRICACCPLSGKHQHVEHQGSISQEKVYATAAPRPAPRHPKKIRLLTTFMITCIIWSEICARLAWLPCSIWGHVTLALVIMALVPFTFLRHILYFSLYWTFAARRWRYRYIA